uniref:Transmembrane protein n=1 Tax=Entomoneis paludosa TaxID=265537 RepID=A0A7S2Y9H9_9STRA|mmetsp:Transcript_23536/g.48865  ORF Transcript_23536/g.48865 Transcript_23536/m.48865 type:complete len:731 (+) Transcript_23536:121-2313(+)
MMTRAVPLMILAMMPLVQAFTGPNAAASSKLFRGSQSVIHPRHACHEAFPSCQKQANRMELFGHGGNHKASNANNERSKINIIRRVWKWTHAIYSAMKPSSSLLQRWRQRLLALVLAFVVSWSSFGSPPSSHATAASSLGLLQQHADIPSLTLSTDSYLSSPDTATKQRNLLASASKTSTAATSATASTRHYTQIVTASGTILLAAVGGVALSRYILNNNKSEEDDDEDADMDDSTRPRFLDGTGIANLRESSAIDVSNVRRDFETIRIKDGMMDSTVQEAQSLLSEIQDAVQQSSDAIAEMNQENDKNKVGNNDQDEPPAILSKLQGNESGLSRRAAKERDDEARKMVESVLKRVEEAERQAIELRKEQEQFAKEMKETVENSERRENLAAEQVALPPVLEETEFANWTQAMDDIDLENESAIVPSESDPQVFFLEGTGAITLAEDVDDVEVDNDESSLAASPTTESPLLQAMEQLSAAVTAPATNITYRPVPQPEGYKVVDNKPKVDFPSIEDMYDVTKQGRPMSKSQMRAFVNDLPFVPEPPATLPPVDIVDPDAATVKIKNDVEETLTDPTIDEIDNDGAKEEDIVVEDKDGAVEDVVEAEESLASSESSIESSTVGETETPTFDETEKGSEKDLDESEKEETELETLSTTETAENEIENELNEPDQAAPPKQAGSESSEQMESVQDGSRDDLDSKYGSIDDVGERAFQILMDLGMVKDKDDDKEK